MSRGTKNDHLFNEKIDKFAKLIADGEMKAHAAILCGYSEKSAGVSAHSLLQREDVQKRIAYYIEIRKIRDAGVEGGIDGNIDKNKFISEIVRWYKIADSPVIKLNVAKFLAELLGFFNKDGTEGTDDFQKEDIITLMVGDKGCGEGKEDAGGGAEKKVQGSCSVEEGNKSGADK